MVSTLEAAHKSITETDVRIFYIDVVNKCPSHVWNDWSDAAHEVSIKLGVDGFMRSGAGETELVRDIISTCRDMANYAIEVLCDDVDTMI